MRALGAALLVIAILALGFVALSMQTQGVEDAAVTNGTNASETAYNIGDQVQETTGNIVVNAALYGGVLAGILVGAGLLLTYGARGRGR